jgi:hypothetical protein
MVGLMLLNTKSPTITAVAIMMTRRPRLLSMRLLISALIEVLLSLILQPPQLEH